MRASRSTTGAPGFIAIAVVGVLLAGCAAIPKGWQKPGASVKEFADAQQACLDAGSAAPDAFEGCMRTKGWEQTMLRGFFSGR